MSERTTRSMTRNGKMYKAISPNRRVTRSMVRDGKIPSPPVVPVKPWCYKEPWFESGLWYLNEIPDSQIQHLVGFPGPLRLNTMVLHHSSFGDFWHRLNRTEDEDLTKKQIISIGKKNKPVTFAQIKNALNRVPRCWYASGRTFWFEGIKYVNDDECEFDFVVRWGT